MTVLLPRRSNSYWLTLVSALFLLLQAGAAFADSEASSEAASESPLGGGRGRGWWRYQMQQQRMAAQQAQQARRQQQMQMQQQRKQNAATAAQRNRPFRASDYIHEYGSGKSRGNFRNRNFGGQGGGQANVGTSSSVNNLPATSSVPFQKFPPK